MLKQRRFPSNSSNNCSGRTAYIGMQHGSTPRKAVAFFFSLSLANPRQIPMRLLERTLGPDGPKDTLLQFENGRRNVIWALEGLALHSRSIHPFS